MVCKHLSPAAHDALRARQTAPAAVPYAHLLAMMQCTHIPSLVSHPTGHAAVPAYMDKAREQLGPGASETQVEEESRRLQQIAAGKSMQYITDAVHH